MTDQSNDNSFKEALHTPEADKARKQSAAGKRGDNADKGTPLPKINFSTFIFSLNSSALLHLGLVPDPITGEKGKNLPMAKQSIDILGIMDEKTKGNLTEDEEKLLRNILHDLRLMYVKESRG